MNANTSLGRIMLYARKHYAENATGYLIRICAMMAILALTLYDYHGTGMVGAALLIWPLFCTPFAFRSHYDPKRMQQAYTLPVSRGEQYIFLWLQTMVIMPAMLVSMAELVAAIYGFDICWRAVVREFLPLVSIYTAILMVVVNWRKSNVEAWFVMIFAGFVLLNFLYAQLLITCSSAYTNELSGAVVRLFYPEGSIMLADKAFMLTYPIRSFFSEVWSAMILFYLPTLLCHVVAYLKFRERQAD